MVRVKKPAYIVLSLLLLILIATVYQRTRNDDVYVTKAGPQLPNPPLKELAEQRGVAVGSFASLKYLRERAYTDILSSEFEYAIIDGEPNWKFEDFTLRPSKSEFNFANLDAVFAYADENDMPVRVQHMLWGDVKWLPEWLTAGNFSDEELMSIIENHIKTVGARYKGKVREYTVVNEAFSRKLETGGNKDWWGQRLDFTYIDNAFVWARQTDPNAVLILNDFGNEYDSPITNLMYEYVSGALARGIPIDGIGMQMHISGTQQASKDEVKATMQKFATLGLKVYVTEFDVNMHDFDGSEEEKNQKQADIYRDMVAACVEVGPEVCPNFGFLGLIDRQSWYNGIGLDEADPLMFTSDYEPKPAFFAVREAFEKQEQ